MSKTNDISEFKRLIKTSLVKIQPSMFGKICTKSIPRHRSLEPTSIQLHTVILLIFLFTTVDTTQLFFTITISIFLCKLAKIKTSVNEIFLNNYDFFLIT